MPGVLTGLAWYRRDEWPLLASLAADPERFEPTYDQWLVVAQRSYLNLEHQGASVVKVDVALADLVAWCHEQGRELNEDARSAFVAHRLRDSEAANNSHAAPASDPGPPQTSTP